MAMRTWDEHFEHETPRCTLSKNQNGNLECALTTTPMVDGNDDVLEICDYRGGGDCEILRLQRQEAERLRDFLNHILPVSPVKRKKAHT